MNTQSTIDAVARLLDRKQAVPSQIIRNLLTDLKAYYALSVSQAKRLAELEAELKAIKEGVK
jgi:hypothetical protein